MGNRSDLARQQKTQLEEKHKAEAKIRVRIYQDLLALLDIAERLTVELSSHQDRFGLEWAGLARPIQTQYNADLVRIIPGLQTMILSKDGAHGLPKGLYRHLLGFAEECAGFLQEARGGGEPAAAPDRGNFHDTCARFKKACAEMRQQICIFENERGAGEESFFG